MNTWMSFSVLAVNHYGSIWFTFIIKLSSEWCATFGCTNARWLFSGMFLWLDRYHLECVTLTMVLCLDQTAVIVQFDRWNWKRPSSLITRHPHSSFLTIISLIIVTFDFVSFLWFGFLLIVSFIWKKTDLNNPSHRNSFSHEWNCSFELALHQRTILFNCHIFKRHGESFRWLATSIDSLCVIYWSWTASTVEHGLMDSTSVHHDFGSLHTTMTKLTKLSIRHLE